MERFGSGENYFGGNGNEENGEEFSLSKEHEGKTGEPISQSKNSTHTSPAPEAATEAKYDIVKDPRLRKLLAMRTVDLIEKIWDENVSQLIFLDKSARPIATLFLDLWKKFSPEQAPPKISFMHIGQRILKSLNYHHWPSDEDTKRYLELERRGEIKRIKEDYKYLAGAASGEKTIVVDEYSQSGNVLELSKQIVHAIFPNLEVSTFPLITSDDEEALGDDYIGVPWNKSGEDDQYSITGVEDPSRIRRASRSSKSSLTSITTDELLDQDSDRTSKEINRLKDDKLKLRKEMHRIAEEYWS